MIEIIVGEKGKGKTKILLEKVNKDMQVVSGDIVYLDKSSKHMYELDSKIRLINICDYPISTTDGFMGFLSGILSQNNDIQEIFLDSFLTISFIDTTEGFEEAIDKLDSLSEKFDVKFVLSVSKNESELPENAKNRVLVAL